MKNKNPLNAKNTTTLLNPSPAQNTATPFKNAGEIIQITDSARIHIQKFLVSMGEHAGFRFGVKKSGCSGYAYVADVVAEPKKNELCMEINGIRVFMDETSIPIVQGTIIDLIEKDLGQKQLYFNNGNIEDSCGCGESFTVKADKKTDE